VKGMFSSPLPVRFSTDAGGCAVTLELDGDAPAVSWFESGAIWIGENAEGRLTALTAYGRSPAEARGLMAMALERLGPRVLATLASLLGAGGGGGDRRGGGSDGGSIIT
jgi:hypothetical protein